MRFQSVQAGPIMQTPVFLILFFAPVYVPLKLLQGWIHGVATANPITQLLEAIRGLLAGQPAEVGIAYLVAAGLIFFLGHVGDLQPAPRRGEGLSHQPPERLAQSDAATPTARSPRRSRARAPSGSLGQLVGLGAERRVARVAPRKPTISPRAAHEAPERVHHQRHQQAVQSSPE